MAVAFVESMRGEVTDLSGGRHVLDFEVRAHAIDLSRFVRDGLLVLQGVVHAPPWAEEAPAEGELELSPLTGGTLRYDLRFRDGDGRPMRLQGVKSVSIFHPVRSMVQMPTRLEREGEPLAQGELRFDLGELLAFAASWTAVAAIPEPDRTDAEPTDTEPAGALTPAERRLLAAVGRGVIAPNDIVPAFDADSMGRVTAVLGRLPRQGRALYRLALRTLDAAALATGGRRLTAMDDGTRRTFLTDLNAKGRLLRPVIELASLPIKAGHFSRADYKRAIGFPVDPPPVADPRPRWMDQVVAAEDLEAETDVEAEVVVVGTGAGGAALAAGLAAQGVAVALIEEGRYRSRADFAGPALDRVCRLWKHAGVTHSVGRPPISIPLGRLVGGTTAINSGTCFRAPDAVLESWRREHGFPHDFAPERFAGHYDRVHAELDVAPSERRYLGRIADVVGRGADAMGLVHGALPRNAPGCDGAGACIFGCPTGAKRSTDVSYVPRALQAGAQLFTGLPVTRLLMHGRRAVGVEARGVALDGASRRLRIRAEAVVVAAGAVSTPVLLMANGFRLPQLGRNLSIHPGFGALALYDEPIRPWDGVPQGYGVQGFEDEGIRFEGYYTPPELSALMVPAVGAELGRWMGAHARTGSFGFMVRDENRGRVRRAPSGRALIRYDLSDESVDKLKRGAAVLSEILLRGGGNEVLPSIAGRAPIRSVAEARGLVHEPIGASDFRLIGCHPLATCRMGATAETAVVDYEHRVFGTDNLYVVDGSVVPTSLGVNPQMTIMAFASRAAAILGTRLR